MMPGSMKNALSSHKPTLLGLVFVLLALVIFCGNVQPANHFTAEGAECSRSLLLMSHTPLKDDGFILSVLFFSFVALALLTKGDAVPHRNFDTSIHPSPIFLKVAESIPKLYNPILEALRRGILNPQIYSFAATTR